MPGIADSTVQALPSANTAALAGEQSVSPAVGDLMSSFRNGFITTEDITKRAADKPLENAKRQQDLADTNIIRPKQRDVAAKQLDIQSGSLDTQAQTQPKMDEAALFQAESILNKARQGDDKNAILNFYQSVAAPGSLPPKLNPDDPNSGYDFAKIEQANQNFVTEQRKLQSATALGKFVKTFTSSNTDSAGKKVETITRMNEATGEVLGKPTKIGETAPQADVLRKEYNNLAEVHDFRKVDAAYQKLNAALDDTAKPSPLRDQGAIFSWMKILDPGSTVREGEYASVKNAAGLPDRLRNAYNRTISGEILTPEQRREIKEAALPIYNGQVQSLAPQLENYLKREEELGISGQIVPPADAEAFKAAKAGSAPAATPAAPASAPVAVNNPSEAPATAQFIKAPDGRVFKNPKYVAPAQ